MQPVHTRGIKVRLADREISRVKETGSNGEKTMGKANYFVSEPVDKFAGVALGIYPTCLWRNIRKKGRNCY